MKEGIINPCNTISHLEEAVKQELRNTSENELRIKNEINSFFQMQKNVRAMGKSPLLVCECKVCPSLSSVGCGPPSLTAMRSRVPLTAAHRS